MRTQQKLEAFSRNRVCSVGLSSTIMELSMSIFRSIGYSQSMLPKGDEANYLPLVSGKGDLVQNKRRGFSI